MACPGRYARPGRVISALLALLLAGCGSTDQPEPDTSDHGNGTHTAGQREAAPTGLPSGASLSSSCRGPAPRDQRSPLEAVRLVVHGDDLVLAYRMVEPVAGPLTLTFTAGSGSGAETDTQQKGFTVTAAVVGATPAALTITTATGSASHQAVHHAVHVAEDEVHVGLPADLLAPLGQRWHWSATAVSDTARARCPAAVGAAAVVPVTMP